MIYSTGTELTHRHQPKALASSANYVPVPQNDAEATTTLANHSATVMPAMDKLTNFFAYCHAKMALNFDNIKFDSLSGEYLCEILQGWMETSANAYAVEKKLSKLLPKMEEPSRFELAKTHIGKGIGHWKLIDLKEYDLTEPHRFEIAIHKDLSHRYFEIEKQFSETVEALDLTPEHLISFYIAYLKTFPHNPFFSKQLIQSLPMTNSDAVIIASHLALLLKSTVSPFIPLFKLTSKQRAAVFVMKYELFERLLFQQEGAEKLYEQLKSHQLQGKVVSGNINDVQYYDFDREDYLNVVDILSRGKIDRANDLIINVIQSSHFVEYLFDCAKLFAHNQPAAYAQNHHNFDLSEDQLVETIKVSLRRNVTTTLNSLHLYKLAQGSMRS